MKSFSKARMELVFSMSIFGTLALFVRNIPLNSGELALYRAILAAALILVYLLVTRQPMDTQLIKKALPLLLLSGAAMGVNWILLFQAYRYTTVSVATLSYYFAPVIVTILSPILYHERITPRQLLCFIMSTVGLILIISGNGLQGGSANITGILFGLGAACFYAVVILLNKYIHGISGIHRTLMQFFAAIIVLIPYIACTGGTHLDSLNITGWLCLLIVGLFHTGITYCLYFSAISQLPGQEIAILSYMDPLVSIIVSVVILHEPMTFLQLIGGILILGFTLWNERSIKES